MAIHKPEWFKMDPAKFLSDAEVEIMTTLELGACFRLMCRQWIDGFIPDDQNVLARLCRIDISAMAQAWVTLSRFFPLVESGKRANRFMWIERAKVVADLEKRSDEGTKAARKRWDDARNRNDAKPNRSPIPDPIQDQTRADQSRTEKHSLSEQSCSDVVILCSKKQNHEPSREAVQLAALLKSEILRNKSDYRITQQQERKWAITADRILRIDQRKFEETAELIRWVQRDDFWMANVLSMDTLRKKFDQLAMASKAKNHNRPPSAQKLPADYVPASEQIKRALQQHAAVMR